MFPFICVVLCDLVWCGCLPGQAELLCCEFEMAHFELIVRQDQRSSDTGNRAKHFDDEVKHTATDEHLVAHMLSPGMAFKV